MTTIKLTIAAIIAWAAFAGAAWAAPSCFSHTYYIDGKLVKCTTCFVDGSNTTTCI